MDKSNHMHSVKVVVLLAVSGLLVVAQLYLSIPLVVTLSEAFGIAPTLVPAVGTAFGFAYAVGFLVFGPLVDRYSSPVVLKWGLGILAVVTVAVGFSPTFEGLLVLRIVQGLAAATFAPAALAYASETLTDKQRAIGIATITTGFLLASILGQVYGEIVSLILGWRWIFWALAPIYAVFALIIGLWPAERQRSASIRTRTAYLNMIKLLGNSTLVAAYLATITILLSFVALYSVFGPHLQAVYGLATDQMLLVRLAGVPGILVSPLVGWIVPYIGRKQTVIYGFICAAFGLGLAALANQLVLLIIATSIFVLGIAIVVPALIDLIGFISGAARGAAIAVYTFVLFIGASLGPQLALLVQPLGFKGSCSVLAAILLGAAAIVALIVQTSKATVVGPVMSKTTTVNS